MKFSDFFKPRWKHSDPRIRAEAIREMEGNDSLQSLKEVVLSDRSNDNRKNALRKISDEACLYDIIQKSGDKNLSDAAQRKLNDLWAKKIKNGVSEQDAIKIIQKIKDPKALEEIATTSSHHSVRQFCQQNITNPSSFYKIALAETHADLGMSALERVKKSLHLENLAKKAKNKQVRQKAKERLQIPGITPSMPSQERVLAAKFDLICRTLEDLQAPKNWNTAHQKAKEAEEGWDHLLENETPSPDIIQRYEKAKNAFWDIYQQHESKLAEKKKQENRLKSALEKKQDLLDLFEQTLTTKATFERNQKLEQISQEWSSLPIVSAEEEEENNLKFQRFLAEYRKEKMNQDEVLTLEQNVESLFHQLQQICNVSSFEDHLEDQIEKAKNQWHDLKINDESPQQKKFDQLCIQAEQNIEALKEQELNTENQRVTEMEEIIKKIDALIDDPDLVKSEKTFKDLNHHWKGVDEFNLYPAEIRGRVEALREEFFKIGNRFRENLEWFRWANLKKKQDICDQLDTLLKEQSDPAELFGKWRELQVDWKAIGPVSWENTKETWDRYRKITDDIYERCQGFFAELEEERKNNLKEKQSLCAEVEEQIQAQNWKDASELVRDAQSKWKDIGPVPKENSEEIWEKFKDLCDRFYQGRKEYFQQFEKEKEGNYAKKIALCELAEQHKDSTNWKETAELFKKAQKDWKEIGPVPREHIETLWKRFRDACDTFFQNREDHFKELNQQKDQNLQLKIELCEKVENLDQVEADQDKFELIKEAQATWKKIGPVPKDHISSIWERFRKPIDQYFEGRKEKFEEEKGKREDNLKIKQELVEQAQKICESKEWRNTSTKLKELQAKWKETGPAPREQDRQCWLQFRQACDLFFNRMKDHYKQLDEQRELNFQTKMDLCYQSEMMAGFEIASDAPETNEADWVAKADQVRELQKKWKATGPVPKSKSDELWQRFRMACDYVFDYARAVSADEQIDLEKNLQTRIEIADAAERISNQVHTDSQIQKIRDLQRDWKMNGPIEHEAFPELWQKFRSACDVVFSEDERLRE